MKRFKLVNLKDHTSVVMEINEVENIKKDLAQLNIKSNILFILGNTVEAENKYIAEKKFRKLLQCRKF